MPYWLPRELPTCTSTSTRTHTHIVTAKTSTGQSHRKGTYRVAEIESLREEASVRSCKS